MTFTRVLDKARCAYRCGRRGNPAQMNGRLYHKHKETKHCDGSKTQSTCDATVQNEVETTTAVLGYQQRRLLTRLWEQCFSTPTKGCQNSFDTICAEI
jgi:hypothetical protein